MPQRYNSQRTLLKATYVPTNLPTQALAAGATKGQAPPAPARVMAKVAFVRGLGIRTSEFAALAKSSIPARQQAIRGTATANKTTTHSHFPRLLGAINAVTSDLAPQTMDAHSGVLAKAVPEDIAAIARALSVLRAETASQLADALRAIRGAYAGSLKTLPELVAMPDAVAWALQIRPPEFQQLLDLVQPLVDNLNLATARTLLTQVADLLHEAVATDSLIDNFLLSFSFEPVGRIHLERVEMTPIGVEHGELVYSVPLTPKETVNITHKEWSETTSTFETLVGESLEGFTEKGVTEKTDMATASSSETKHSSSFDANASVNFSYNGNPYSLTTSAAVDYKTSNEDSTSIKDSRAHSIAVTRTASARTRREHKQSFRVTSVAGTEDLAVRTLTNPSDTNALRIDYFRLMRKWQVDLIRYGLRMTYDLVIPNPGNALASKVRERDNIALVLAAKHEFQLSLDDITSDSYRRLATDYGAELDPPPDADAPGLLSQSVALQSTGNKWQFAAMTFNVDEGFVVDTIRLWAQYYHDGDGNIWFGARHGQYQPEGGPKEGGGWDPGARVAVYDTDQDPALGFTNSYKGKSGQLNVEYMYYHVDSGQVDVTIEVQPTGVTRKTWQLKAWNTLKRADDGLYQTALKRLADRQAELDKEISDYDSLTLRRMEREEIMRLVLVWLFGPKFQFVPTTFELLGLAGSLATVPDPMPELSLDPGQMTISEWDSVRKYGDFIKYIHNAIEWENVLYFTYPYFWDLVENWQFKRFLVHPDFDRRNFLRAGCARVIVPVRPGFEKSFAQLVEHFTLPVSATDQGTVPEGHPYISIGDEMRNYAMTNYEHTPPANPDRNVRPLLHPLQQRAWGNIQKWMLLLEDYNAAHQPKPKADPPYAENFYPAKLEDLKTYAQNRRIDLETISTDPWQRPYEYKSPGDHGDYDLFTYGKNGKPAGANPLDDPSSWGSDMLDQPITSWAEGNIVGRWFEYTPTSALDVGITTIPPSNFQLPTKPEPV
jgi:hypothetical protein